MFVLTPVPLYVTDFVMASVVRALAAGINDVPYANTEVDFISVVPSL